MNMPRKRFSLKSDVSKDDFETGVFKNFNEESDKGSEKSDDDINFGTEDGVEDDDSDDDLLVNSDSDDVHQEGDDISSRLTGAIDDDNSDDDDVPEAISFSSSKQSAMEQMKKAMKQIDEVKQKTKLKRKNLDDKYKEQKRKKLEELSKNRLPDEFLADLSEVTESKKLHSEEKAEKRQSKKVKFKAKNLSSEDEDVGSLADTEEDFKETEEDFIPLESDKLGGVEVISLTEEKKSKLPVSKNVLNFKDQWLYGKSNHRESTKSKLAKIAKRRARFT